MNKRKIAIISLVTLFLLGIGGWNLYGWWLKHKLESYKAELVAQGEKLTIAEFIADHRVPEFNSADLFNRSTAFMQSSGILTSNPPTAMRMVSPGRALIGWQQPLLIDKETWKSKAPITNTWEELAEEIARSQEGIELLHEIIAHPDLDFHLDYNAGAFMLLPHLAPLKRSAQVLSAAAMLDLHNGNPASATKHIRATLAVAKGIRDEPTVISQLVRIAVVHIVTTSTWELLQSTNVSDADLKLTQADFADQDFIAGMKGGFEFERVMMGSYIQRFREHGGIYDMYAQRGAAPTTKTLQERLELSFSPKELRKSSNELLWQSALSYEDELLNLEGMGVLIESVRAAATNQPMTKVCSNAHLRLKIGSKSDDDSFSFGNSNGDEVSLGSLRKMFSGTGESLWKCLQKVMMVEANKALVVTAIAIKRHQLRSGNLPPTLDALVPEFLTAVPRDPVDGKPLRYQPMPDGRFLLYSVGENGIDDGGDASPANTNSNARPNMLRGRDMVWPQPATPDEIRASQEKKADAVIEPEPVK